MQKGLLWNPASELLRIPSPNQAESSLPPRFQYHLSCSMMTDTHQQECTIVDVQVDSTVDLLYAHFSPHEERYNSVTRGSAKHWSETSLDPRLGRVNRAILMSSATLENWAHHAAGLGLACFAKKVLRHSKPCMRKTGVMIDQVEGWASSNCQPAVAK